jgi:hypothetical protein
VDSLTPILNQVRKLTPITRHKVNVVRYALKYAGEPQEPMKGARHTRNYHRVMAMLKPRPCVNGPTAVTETADTVPAKRPTASAADEAALCLRAKKEKSEPMIYSK